MNTLTQSNIKIGTYRQIQRAKCIERDKGYCVICYYKGKYTQGTEVHHVFGRGNSVESFKEHYTSLLVVCRKCHPLPAQDMHSKQAWVIDILDKVNETPINKRFIHDEYIPPRVW